MTNGSARLIKYGYAKKEAKPYDTKDQQAFEKELADRGSEQVEKDADHHEIEIAKDQYMLFDYPKPVHSYYLVYESYQNPIEPIYFWCLGQLQYDLGFPVIDKVTDIFTAAEQSSFYGASAQRLGLAQDKASTLMAQIGQFIKRDLFQLVRDIRWIDERLNFHNQARNEEDEKIREKGELTLKGIWCDLIDGVVQGQRVSANVFQMAQQLQFTSLPDFFFGRHPKDDKDIGPVVDNISTTPVVKDVLKRKYTEFMAWKKANFEELQQRRKFELQYLRQHYHIIKMYMHWLKPYLRHIERMSDDVSKLGKADMISAFEGSLVEIEILARKMPSESKGVYSCILMTFEYRTKPSLQFQVEAGYHRGPIHVGETKISWRAYAWNDKEVENYINFKKNEDFEMLGKIDKTIEATLKAMGNDLEKYIKEAEEATEPKKEEKKEEKKKPSASMFEPVTALYDGFKELFWTPFFPAKEEKKDEKRADKSNAEKDAKKMLWTHYKNFKKAHGMFGW